MKHESAKMTTRDYITGAIFSVLSIVCMMISAIANMSGKTALFYPALTAFFIGILFLILLVKVPKRGIVIVFSIVPAVYFLTSGLLEGMIGITGILIFAFLTEWILSKDRSSLKRITLGGLVYTMNYSTIGFAENFLATDNYCDNALAHGINPSVVEGMRRMYAIKPLWAVAIAATLLTAFLGMQVGKIIMKKHLKKVGLA